MVPRVLASRYDYDLARHALHGPRLLSLGHRAPEVRAARKAGPFCAPGRPRGSRSARRQAWLGPPGRGHRSASNANLSRRSRPRRAVVTATACAGFRRHRGVHTKVGITFLLSLWAGAEHRSWPRGGFVLNPRRSRLPEIPAEAGAVGAVSRGERACSLPVTRTRVRAGVAPRGCPVREGVERVVSVYLRDGVDESRPSTSTATRRWG